MSMNAQDLCNIQECLISYRKLIEWLPATCKEELDLKTYRIDIINYLMNRCGSELNKISETYRSEE